MPSNLTVLPPDLLVHEILLRLPFESITSCLRTCRLLHSIITSSPLLTYRRELQLAGMIDNPRCTYSEVPITERLAMLREREARWLHLDPKAQFVMKTPPNISTHYDLTSGICVLGHATDDMVPGALSARLPKEKEESAKAQWDQFNMGIHMIDFSLATETHDLIVFVTCPKTLPRQPMCHLYQHSTRLPHPLADRHVLDIPVSITNEEVVYTDIEISGDNLIVLFRYHCPIRFDYVPSLIVFNWKTGSHKLPRTLVSEGLAFLREDIILNPNTLNHCLDAYHIPPWDDHDENAVTVHIARLQLPETYMTSDKIYIYTRVHPNPYPSSQPYPSYIPIDRPFVNDPGSAIVLFLLGYQSGSEWLSFCMLSHRQSLLDLVLESAILYFEHPQSEIARNISRVVWEKWGPKATRWFECQVSLNSWLTTVSGPRWVRIRGKEGATPQERKCRLDVLDFSPLRISKARRAIKTSGGTILTGHEHACGVSSTRGHIKIKDDPTVIKARSVFRDDIVTSLPYISTTYIQHPEEEEAKSRKRDKVVKWVHNVAKKTGIAEREYFTCHWDSPMLDEERIVGSVSERSVFLPYELDIMYLG